MALERYRFTIDLLLEEDQYLGKIDIPIVNEQAGILLKEVTLANMGIVVVRYEAASHPLHQHDGESGCQTCFGLAEDGQRPRVKK